MRAQHLVDVAEAVEAARADARLLTEAAFARAAELSRAAEADFFASRASAVGETSARMKEAATLEIFRVADAAREELARALDATSSANASRDFEHQKVLDLSSALTSANEAARAATIMKLRAEAETALVKMEMEEAEKHMGMARTAAMDPDMGGVVMIPDEPHQLRTGPLLLADITTKPPKPSAWADFAWTDEASARPLHVHLATTAQASPQALCLTPPTPHERAADPLVGATPNPNPNPNHERAAALLLGSSAEEPPETKLVASSQPHPPTDSRVRFQEASTAGSGQDRRRDLRQLFDEADSDGSGRLSKRELYRALSSMGLTFKSASQQLQVWKAYDQEQLGTVSFSVFYQLSTLLLEQQSQHGKLLYLSDRFGQRVKHRTLTRSL